MPKRKCSFQLSNPWGQLLVNNSKKPNIDSNHEIKIEPSDELICNHENYSSTIESLESDISNFQNDSFSIIKDKINLLGSHDSIQSPNILEKIMTKLNSLDDKMNEIKLEISTLKRTITSNNIDSENSNFQFDKCQSIDELKEFAKNLQNKNLYSKMVTICSKLPGNDVYDATYKILTFLTRKNVLGNTNKTGTFNKTKFPVIISQLIYESILLNFDCTYMEIEKSIGRVLHNCIPDAKRSLLK